MLTIQEQETLSRAGALLAGEITIGLRLTDSRQSREFQQYGELLKRLSPKLQLQTETKTGALPPALTVGTSILLHALPRGTELPPFTELLLAASRQGPPAAEVPPVKDAGFKLPAQLTLYVTPACPFCPVVMKALFPLALAHGALSLNVIDATLFPEMAEAAGIRSVPTLLLDDSFRWTGAIDVREVLNAVRYRDPAALGVASLKSMILNGEAFQLAEMMLREKKIFSAFVELLIHEEFSTRLGAMAAAEELAERNRDVASQLVGPLLDRFAYQSDPIKGDMLYILGKTGDRRILHFLRDVQAGAVPAEVKEAAAEAVDTIQSRSK